MLSGIKRTWLGRVCGLVACLVVMGLSSCGSSPAAPRSPVLESHYGELAKSVFDASNRLRVNPSAYVEILAQRSKLFAGKIYYIENDPVGHVTREGAAAVDEAAEVLRKYSADQPLRWSEELAALARAHVADTGARGIIGHDGSGKNTFDKRIEKINKSGALWAGGENISYGVSDGREVVLQLLIDDGVASRGHRDNLLSADFNISGVGCGYHRKYGTMCVVMYGMARH